MNEGKYIRSYQHRFHQPIHSTLAAEFIAARAESGWLADRVDWQWVDGHLYVTNIQLVQAKP